MHQNLRQLKAEFNEVEVAEHAVNVYERYKLVERASETLLERIGQLADPTSFLEKYVESAKHKCTCCKLNFTFQLEFYVRQSMEISKKFGFIKFLDFGFCCSNLKTF
jgi:hypothetical protein